MATLADLKQRVITDMSRDDLEDDLSALLLMRIQDACEYYADTKFWFNSILTTVNTVAGVATVTIPATVRVIERVTIPAYVTELRETVLTELGDDTVQSVPDWYAYYNDLMRFYPIPDAVYTLNIYGVSKVAAPAVDADTSIWTNEAARLISAHTKMLLYRGKFRDPDGAQLAMGEVSDELTRLKRETAKRLETPLRPTMRGGRYNIMTDR